LKRGFVKAHHSAIRYLFALFVAFLTLGPASAMAQSFDDGLAAYGRGDYAEALRQWRPLAEGGRAGAQYNLGVMYGSGEGTPQDYAEAARWYRSAAEQGYADAQFNLGIMYRDGQGIMQNDTEAFTWFQAAAEQGGAHHQYYLASVYGIGALGAPRDYVESARWLRPAAEQGYADAQFGLALLFYEGGFGLQQDYEEAYYWFALAKFSYFMDTMIDETAGVKSEDAMRYMDLIAANFSPDEIAEIEGRVDASQRVQPQQ